MDRIAAIPKEYALASEAIRNRVHDILIEFIFYCLESNIYCKSKKFPYCNKV